MTPNPIKSIILPFIVHTGSPYMNEEVGPMADSLWSVNIIPKAIITSPIVSSFLLANSDNFMPACEVTIAANSKKKKGVKV